uniref:WAP domain-containing protein n=1 Tax=Trichuris muris TaxID=70415 RepID=A0A5S6QZ51_TRIMR
MDIRLCIITLLLLPCCLCIGYLYAGLYPPVGPPFAPGFGNFAPYSAPCLPGAFGCPAGPAYPLRVCPAFVGPVPPYARHACLLPRHCPLGTRCCVTPLGRRCLPGSGWW